MTKRVDLTGQTFTRLTVLRVSERLSDDGKAMWWVQCQCGTQKEVIGRNLRKGDTKSCGCLKLERVQAMGRATAKSGLTYGANMDRRYYTWNNMHHRCYSLNNSRYASYGGRGIYVEWEWHEDNPEGLTNFLRDVGPRPPDPLDWNSVLPYYTLDRIDNNGPYGPGNFRWATWQEQRLNQQPHRLKKEGII